MNGGYSDDNDDDACDNLPPQEQQQISHLYFPQLFAWRHDFLLCLVQCSGADSVDPYR